MLSKARTLVSLCLRWPKALVLEKEELMMVGELPRFKTHMAESLSVIPMEALHLVIHMVDSREVP
jgi:hypothetical protein